MSLKTTLTCADILGKLQSTDEHKFSYSELTNLGKSTYSYFSDKSTRHHKKYLLREESSEYTFEYYFKRGNYSLKDLPSM